MRWVDQAVTRPHRCAMFPQIGNGMGHAFLDTGQDLDLEHVYLSDVACIEAAKAVGWVDPAAIVAAENHVKELKARIEELEEENNRLQDFYDHADGLVKHGLRVARPTGRPKKKEAV